MYPPNGDSRRRQQLVSVLGALAMSAPLAFGAIRAATTGSDFRYLWVALVSSVSAVLVMALGGANHRSTRGVVSLAALAFVVAALDAGLTGVMLGARSGAAVGIVSCAFAFCSAGGLALRVLSRKHEARHESEHGT